MYMCIYQYDKALRHCTNLNGKTKGIRAKTNMALMPSSF